MRGSIYFVRLNEWLIQCIFILLLAKRSERNSVPVGSFFERKLNFIESFL